MKVERNTKINKEKTKKQNAYIKEWPICIVHEECIFLPITRALKSLPYAKRLKEPWSLKSSHKHVGERAHRQIDSREGKKLMNQIKQLTLTPESFSSLSIESITIFSSPSSLIHRGSGVPQNLLRLTAQSLAFSSQLWKRFSWNHSNK